MIDQQKIKDIIARLKSGKHVLVFTETEQETATELFDILNPHTKYVLGSSEIVLKNDTFLCIRKILNRNMVPKESGNIGYEVFFV